MWATQFPRPVQIVRYDDLIKDTGGSLRDILNFIEFPIDDELLACAVSRKQGLHKRQKTNREFDPFTPEMHETIAKRRDEVYKRIGLEGK